ncbi:STF2 [[Candida] subhashii]|uniref:STF2 n=1 Tax=[Candida] subhashii TaxID=561895 RepID=A0A8J5UZ38_9ASCO|nr:STF2 [[Candida] subhashii]KAG7663409.1 STF2 [[Candida] subhashii]
MTRTNKWNVNEQKAQESKWFTHHGYYDSDPTKTKKEGAGNFNWGKPGDELDDEDIKMYNKSTVRRNSNHETNQEKLRELNQKLDNEIFGGESESSTTANSSAALNHDEK